jgi:hypothetical protein
VDFENEAYHLDNDCKKPAKAASQKSAMKNSRRTSSHSKSAKKASSKKESNRKASKTAHFDDTKVYSRNDYSDDEAVAMLEEEKKRPSSKFNKFDRREGFGSFYDRPPYDNSVAEKTARIGQKDRVRTVDLSADDQVKYRLEESDDSERSSDWEKRTGFTMKSARLRGSSRHSSTRMPNKALAAYMAKKAAEKSNLKE